MSIDESTRQPDRAQMRQLVGEQISQAPAPLPWASVATRQVSVRSDLRGVPGRSRVVLVAVAASFVALLVALAVVGPGADPAAPSDTPPSPSALGPVPLAEVTDIGDQQWVIPTEVPGELEFQYAMRSGESRSVRAGTDAQPERLIIHLDTSAPVRTTSSQVSIGGRTWAVAPDAGGWNAWLVDGSTAVVVYGSGPVGDDTERLLGSLQVVPTDMLPYAPLDPNGPMVEVATYDLDGERYELAVDEANGYICTAIRSSSGGQNVGCGGVLSTDVFASSGGGGGYTVEDGSTIVRAESSGVVRDDVKRVEVEFVDGSIVSVETTNSTDRFDGFRFWVLAADIQVGDGTSSDTLAPVQELRAYDAAGGLLDTRRPGDG